MPPESWCGYSSSRRRGSGMPTAVEQARRPRSRAVSLSMPSVALQHLGDLQADRDAPGSARTAGPGRPCRRSRPRRSRISLSDSVSRSTPSNSTAPVTLFAALGQQAHDRQRGHRLAAAGLADQPDRLAGLDGEADAVHRRTGSARPGAGRRPTGRARRASVPSRSPPVLRVEGLAQRLAEQREAERDDDDRERRVVRQLGAHLEVRSAPRASIRPHSARLVSGSPRPRNDSAAASRIAIANVSVACTMTGAERVRQHVPQHDRRPP